VRNFRGERGGRIAGGAGFPRGSFGGNPIRDFNPGIFLEFKEPKAGLFLRFTEPRDLGVQVQSLPGFGRLDAQSDPREAQERSDRLQREASFTQVEQNAAVVGINVYVSERRQTQAWDATPLVRAPRFLRSEGC
jgi:hypothetical protein